MPEVVYAYSLKHAIMNEYLKQPRFEVYHGEIKSNDFVRTVIKDFWTIEGTARREGMLPKLAFFGHANENNELLIRTLGIELDEFADVVTCRQLLVPNIDQDAIAGDIEFRQDLLDSRS